MTQVGKYSWAGKVKYPHSKKVHACVCMCNVLIPISSRADPSILCSTAEHGKQPVTSMETSLETSLELTAEPIHVVFWENKPS